MAHAATLSRLTAQARQALSSLYRRASWVLPSSADLDVAIVGGGQSGAGIAFALARAGVDRLAVFDAAPAGQAGVWGTTARMETLRTDKAISALDQGIPELGFQHWYDALEGTGAYDALERIPRLAWAAYVDWLRDAMNVQVRHEWRLVDIAPAAAGLTLHFETGRTIRTLSARRLVLATGVDGLGAPFIPDTIRQRLPRACFAHTAETIDFARLRGRRIVVLGAASSAFDAAATALEAGAARVDLLARSQALATQNPYSLARNPALYAPFRDLSDALRWQLITVGRGRGHAPAATIARAQRHAGFHLHEGVPAASVDHDGTDIRLALPQGDLSADYLIAGTGYDTDVGLRPELARVASTIRLWRDTGLPGTDTPWGRFPYLAPDLAFLPGPTARLPADDWVTRIHAFNYGAVLSQGYHVGDIGSHAACVARLTEGIAYRLFAEESAGHLAGAGIVPDNAAHAAPCRQPA